MSLDPGKLQLLNDRIERTIEAIHQLRQLEHGYWASSVTSPWAAPQPLWSSATGTSQEQAVPQLTTWMPTPGLLHASPRFVAGAGWIPVETPLGGRVVSGGIMHAGFEPTGAYTGGAETAQRLLLAQTFPYLLVRIPTTPGW